MHYNKGRSQKQFIDFRRYKISLMRKEKRKERDKYIFRPNM